MSIIPGPSVAALLPYCVEAGRSDGGVREEIIPGHNTTAAQEIGIACWAAIQIYMATIWTARIDGSKLWAGRSSNHHSYKYVFIKIEQCQDWQSVPSNPSNMEFKTNYQKYNLI